jgi:hypothetical protein
MFNDKADSEIMQQDLYKRGLKAYMKLTKMLNPKPNVKTMLHLFDKLIKPVLLYCCEIWTPINLDYRKMGDSHKSKLCKDVPCITKFSDYKSPIEKLHLKFCKFISNKTSTLGTYSELGRYPGFF